MESADTVEQIAGSYKAISIEGRFKITHLMAIKPKTPPLSVIKAVIDPDSVQGPAPRGISDDIIEID